MFKYNKYFLAFTIVLLLILLNSKSYFVNCNQLLIDNENLPYTQNNNVPKLLNSDDTNKINLSLVTDYLNDSLNVKSISSADKLTDGSENSNNNLPSIFNLDSQKFLINKTSIFKHNHYATVNNITNNNHNNSSTNLSQSSSQSALSSTYSVLEFVSNLDVRLKNIRNVELGVTIVQEIFDALDFSSVVQNDSQTISIYADRMSRKLKNALNAVNDLKYFFLQNVTTILATGQYENDDDNEDNDEGDGDGEGDRDEDGDREGDRDGDDGDGDIDGDEDHQTDNEEYGKINDDDGFTSSSSSSLLKRQRASHLFLNTLIQPCNFDDSNLEQTYNKQKIQIFNYLKSNKYSIHDNDLNFKVNAKIIQIMQQMKTKQSHLKHVFFLSKSDHASDHTCQYYFNDVHFRYLYVSAIKKKHVFLLIDLGNSFNSEQLKLLKNFVKNIIHILSPTDIITMVTISDIATPMNLNKTGSSYNMYPVTPDNKYEILKFVSNLNKTDKATNHSKGFEYSFELLRKQDVSQLTPVQFLYITRGLLSRLPDAENVLKAIAHGQKILKYPIIINACAVILDEKRIMYERQFLRDIAEQNYSKYDIDVRGWYNAKFHNLTGNLYIITKHHPENIIKTSSAVFQNLFKSKYFSDKSEIHLPVSDYNTKDAIVSITHAVAGFGVIGVNMYLNDLAEDIIYYKKSEDAYGFIIDINSIVIYHPVFSQAIIENTNKPYPLNIGYLENHLRHNNCIQFLLNNMTGNLSVTLDDINETKIYTWQHVLNTYVVCIVRIIKGNSKQQEQMSRVAAGLRSYHHPEYMSPPELLYHRIDLIPPQRPVCRHFRQIATMDAGTVFLGASSFESPFVYLKTNRENRDEIKTRNAQSIMAYLKDTTSLLVNPGLLPQIRSDVSALYHVMVYLKKRHQEDGAPLKKYIIRRYAATINGVILVYPGCILNTEMEASHRPWFRKAVQHPGKIVATAPYLDAGGAGYIITIAHTIFEGKSNALHSAERDKPIAIVAIDVPYEFFYKLILESLPICSELNIKCFLMEDAGYLIGHPSMMEPVTAFKNNRRPLEHVTHKESFFTNDILNHKILVTKLPCVNYQKSTMERYYKFNSSLNEVLTNVVHGERTKYQITAIRGTNMFAVILNSTCEGGAFCPCSTVDRICMNCNRMDQTDCECPCECPFDMQNSANIDFDIWNKKPYKNLTNKYEYCPLLPDGLAIVNSLSYDWNMVIKSCVNINCEIYSSQFDCLAVMGCEWCQLDVDNNPFMSPFCTAQSSCFNGVLGAPTPYGDSDLGTPIVESVKPPAYSAMGPVGGAIIALCLVVGFAMYCYRQNLDEGVELFCDSLPDGNYGVPLAPFNYDDITTHDDNDLGGGSPGCGNMRRNLINTFGNGIAVPEISPYHMSTNSGTGYGRPNNGESDHGYSTMTPHEDSEHMCFNLVEPLIGNKRLSMSDSISINTSVSSPRNQIHIIPWVDNSENSNHNVPYTSPPTTGQTLLGPTTDISMQRSPHRFFAPVTVHRHMEAS